MERHVGGAPPPHHRGRTVSGTEAAHANEYFEHFLNAATLKNILGYHRSMCELLHLKPNVFPQFYPKLRASLTSWKAKALWKKFDSRISQKCYGKGKACHGTRVLIIGAGPCGLRTAIEAQLLGAKVVVVEKRDRLSRNNVLHLWPFVIEDLRMLGAKKFFGKFCAGAIDHISIRQLQCILLKVALLLGVEIHTEVSFERLREPHASEKIGWRAEVLPKDHPVAQYEFDVIVGADGKRNTLQGFKRKEFRGKLAIAITANFINKKSEAEARVEEISGVAFIFNQKFFKDLQAETRIDLENIVYYKDDTHYFVMTAKKASLLEKGVIKQDLNDTEKLLAAENVDRDALQNYAREAADFSTNYQLPELEFAVNHYGQPDVAMFDFTSMYAAEYASKVIERHGTRLLTILVGDSLLEPFWPTGSGCARGFLSSLDAAWAIRSYCSGQMTALDVLAERESIYRLLAQTTPDNLNKDWKAYTLDPATRYPNLNKSVVTPLQTVCLYDTDAPESIEKMKRASLDSLTRHEHTSKKRRRGTVDVKVVLRWLSEQLRAYDDVTVTDLISVFRPGKALCALLHHYRPDLLDYAHVVNNNEPAQCNQLAMEILEKELGVAPFMTGDELTNSDDFLTLTAFLTQLYDTFRGEIPHVKHPKLELPESQKRSDFSFKTIKTSSQANNQTSRPSSRHKRNVADVANVQKPPSSLDRKQRKRRTFERIAGPSVEERQRTLEQIATNRQDRQEKRKQQRQRQTEQFVKSMQMLQTNRKSDESEPFEDYSIFLYRQTAPKFEDRVKVLEKQFTYVPDYDTKLSGLKPPTNTNAEEDIASKIRSLEDKWSNRQPTEKKPKDLMRAIGKIETSDWNIKQIEKKILENKMGKPSTLNADKERVPRWSKEEFKARQTKMEKKHLDRQDSGETKFADIDRNIKQLDLKLREGTNRELGRSKVAKLTEKLVKETPQNQEKHEKPAQPKPVNLPIQNGSENCHFCAKRVYLMERLSAEGRFFHHGCFKCQYCHTQLRLGSYMFDRDGQFGYRFYCIHHFGMQGELPRPTKIARKPSERGPREVGRSPQKRPQQLSGVAGVDLLDRVETPERVEFANLSSGHVSSDRDEPMDEDEWTDKNFGASANELDDSDDDFSSSLSDTDSDEEEAFDDALEQPMTKEGTMKLAQMVRNTHRKSRDSGSDGYSSSDRSSYYENTSDDSDSETATEGEDEIRARELRRREVLVEAPIVPTDTETDDTEMVSDESSSESSEIQNSATEISTDSEFAQDEPTPTRERAQRCQITSSFIGRDVALHMRPLVVAGDVITPPRPMNALNRTRSTGGIATKVSLELKKKYLLGDGGGAGGGTGLQKSGSAIALDTKFKRFQTTIADCQKLLKVSAEGATVAESKKELPPPDLTVEIPRVEVHPAQEEEEATKSTKSEKKTLNEPKSLPDLEVARHQNCHVTKSSPEEPETEQSDWALDVFDSLMSVKGPKPVEAINVTSLDAHLDSLEYMDRSPSGGGEEDEEEEALLKPSDMERLQLAEPTEVTSSESTVKRAEVFSEPKPAELDQSFQLAEYTEHCQRLQCKVEFGNARDSIDLRKSRKPDLLLGNPRIYSKEHIDKERDVTKKVIEQMVMDKMKAENKILEKRRRRRPDLLVAPPQPPPRRPKSLQVTPLSVATAVKRPKSIAELPKKLEMPKLCKSDTNLVEADKKKERERRKSITKLIAGIFCKKSPTGLFAKLSPKSKSKSLTSLDNTSKHETVIEEPRKCASQSNIQRRESTPPPVPPLPSNYTLKDESSDGENVTLDQSVGNAEFPSGGKRSGKSRRTSRQAQLKRHRMAQEIQRKLEETEVKTREVERRGVEVEKALRGEAESGCARDESELLREWFDLMRDRTELRRYEKELTVRAEELELEDRHQRLQNELLERLENSENKTEDDVTTEQTIVDQMMDIVAKRDSLISILEEDRRKYSHEDKDLEEQMLAKGLMLTPIRKSTQS